MLSDRRGLLPSPAWPAQKYPIKSECRSVEPGEIEWKWECKRPTENGHAEQDKYCSRQPRQYPDLPTLYV